MPESKIITLEKPQYKMDLNLFARVMPCFVVGERVVCLNGIEHIGYEWPETIEEDLTATPPQLAITYASGNVEFFDESEERELESQIKAGIAKSEQQINEMQILAQENAALKQEIGRVMAGQIQGGKIVNPFGRKH